jgi:hypothetical protein
MRGLLEVNVLAITLLHTVIPAGESGLCIANRTTSPGSKRRRVHLVNSMKERLG